MHAQTTPSQLYSQVYTGLSTLPDVSQGKKNILVLGVDEVDGRPETSILTDTMMFVSLNMNTGSITTLSIPRDLWVDTYKSKINAFYQYGRTKYPEKPQQYTTEVVEEVFGVPIHHTIVVSLKDLETVIDLLQGIDVEIPRTFEDTQFPRSGVDVSVVRDPKILYETVRFEQGVEHMTGARALQYIRSRHSLDPAEGTDEARSRRQQEVIGSIIRRMQDPSVLSNLETMGKLYAWYTQRFGSELSPSEVIATARSFYPVVENMSLRAHVLSIKENGAEGVLYHPRNLVFGQWVYLPVDPSWKGVRDEIQRALE